MKKLLLVLLLSLFSASYADTYSFIGYSDSCPVFFNSSTKEIVLKKNDTLNVIKKIKSDNKAVFVKDELIVLEANENGNYFAHLIKGENEKKIPITGGLTFITGNENVLFYSDFRTSEIYMLSFEGIKKMNLQGIVVGFDENCLYYSKENNTEIVSANVDIYKVEIGDLSLKSEQLVVSNLAGEKTIILPKGRYIVDEKLHKGKYRLCLVETKSGNIEFLELPKEIKHFDFYYSLEKNSLDFYNVETLEIYSLLLTD